MEQPVMVYRVLRLGFRGLFRSGYRVEVSGLENVPRQGAAIICCNHIHFWDPLLLAAFVQRPIYFMAKEELFKIPVVKQLITHVGAFPVRRGRPDRQALRQALRLVRDGKLVGLFPEGTRQPVGALGESRPGTGFLVARSGVPVIPAAILGSYEPLQPMKLILGPPMTWPLAQREGGREEMERIGRDIMEGIARLLRN